MNYVESIILNNFCNIDWFFISFWKTLLTIFFYKINCLQLLEKRKNNFFLRKKEHRKRKKRLRWIKKFEFAAKVGKLMDLRGLVSTLCVIFLLWTRFNYIIIPSPIASATYKELILSPFCPISQSHEIIPLVFNFQYRRPHT